MTTAIFSVFSLISLVPGKTHTLASLVPSPFNALSIISGKVCRDIGSESIGRWTAARSTQLNRLSAIFDKMLAIGASCVICLRYCHHSHEDTAATISYLSNSLRLSLVRRLTFSAIQLPLSAPWTNGVGSSRAQ